MEKKKISVVYGGEMGMAVKVFADFFDYEYIKLPPSFDNFRQVEDYFPEEWCFDIKIMYADMIVALEKGADVVIALDSGIFSFIGPCRLPYVAEHQFEKKLRAVVKKDFQYLYFKFLPHVAYISLLSCCKKLGIRISSPKNQSKLRKAKKIIKYKFKINKEIKNLMREVRAREIKKGDAFKIYKDFENEIFDENDIKELETIYSETKKDLEAIEQDKDKMVLKIGVTGDLYGTIWEFPVFDLENYICNLFNVELVYPYSLYDLYFSKKWKDTQALKKKALKYWAGGSDATTLRSYFEFIKEGVDGFIQLRTFGCMPEEVASMAIQNLNKERKKEIPFMILSFDDHSNPEGVKTRIEAFCNTLLRKKKNAKK